MSRETNEGVMMNFKTITVNLLTIVHPLVEPITSLAKPKAYLEASFSIRQLPWTVASTKPVVSPSLFSFFFFRNMLRSNRYSWGTVESHVGRGKFFLTQIMPFIEPHRHEMHHNSNLLALEVIIFMEKSNNKRVKGDKRGSDDAFQNNYDELVYNITPSCWTYYIPWKTKGFSGGIFFH